MYTINVHTLGYLKLLVKAWSELLNFCYFCHLGHHVVGLTRPVTLVQLPFKRQNTLYILNIIVLFYMYHYCQI